MSWLFVHPILKPLKFNLAEDWDDKSSSTNSEGLAFWDLCLLLDMEAQGIILVEVKVFAHVILNPGLHMGGPEIPLGSGIEALCGVHQGGVAHQAVAGNGDKYDDVRQFPDVEGALELGLDVLLVDGTDVPSHIGLREVPKQQSVFASNRVTPLPPSWT